MVQLGDHKFYKKWGIHLEFQFSKYENHKRTSTIYLAVGYEFGNSGKLKIGYMNQVIYKSTVVTGANAYNAIQKYKINNTLMIGWYSNLSFFKKKKE